MFKLFKKNKSDKGSITVEASIVVPIVILSIVAFIFIGLLLYQRALLQSTADEASCAGAASWCASESVGEIALYWRIYDTNTDEKIGNIEKYAQERLKNKNILKAQITNIHAKITDYKIYRKLEVTLENKYKIPVAGFLRIFGFNNYFTIRVNSCAVIDEPAEFIRNVDFVIDVEKELEEKHPEIKDFAQKTRDTISEIKSKIDKLFN